MPSSVTSSDRASPILRAAVRNFVTYNPLFLVSAVLVLAATLLLNPPDGNGGRGLRLLVQLFGAVELYQVSLLAAAIVLARHARLERDVRNLILVLAPFLLDVTFTTSALEVRLWHDAGRASAWRVAGGSVALAALAIGLAARISGRRLGAAAWAALLAGPAVVALHPLVGLALDGRAPEAGVVAGAGLCALALLLGLASAGPAPGTLAVRALAPIALVTATYHVLGGAWGREGGFLLIVGSLLIGLGPALPRIVWPLRADRDASTPLALPALGVFLMLISADQVFGLAAWRAGLAAAGALWLVMAFVLRSPRFILAAGAAAALLFLSRTAPVTVEAAEASSSLDAIIALGAVGLAVLGWTHAVHGRSAAGAPWRLLGAALLTVPAFRVAFGAGPEAGLARSIGWLAVLALAALAWRTRLRSYLAPAPLPAIELAWRLAPVTAAGWGAAGFVAAFALVGLGTVLSLKREAVLAWLERGEGAQPG